MLQTYLSKYPNWEQRFYTFLKIYACDDLKGKATETKTDNRGRGLEREGETEGTILPVIA